MVDYAMDLARIRTSFVNNFQELTDSIFSSAATANLDAESYYFIQALFSFHPINPVNVKELSHRMFQYMHRVLNKVYL